MSDEEEIPIPFTMDKETYDDLVKLANRFGISAEDYMYAAAAIGVKIIERKVNEAIAANTPINATTILDPLLEKSNETTRHH